MASSGGCGQRGGMPISDVGGREEVSLLNDIDRYNPWFDSVASAMIAALAPDPRSDNLERAQKTP